MNLISTMVSLSIAGVASPMLMDMAITPVKAQKQAQNFGLAESAAVLYVAQNRHKTDFDDLDEPREKCVRSGDGVAAVNISCTFGDGKLSQTVVRSFLLPPVGSTGSQFPRERPEGEYSFFRNCPADDPDSPWYDPWGVNGYNETFVEDGKICIPGPAQGGIDPDDDMSTWLWDLRGQGFD